MENRWGAGEPDINSERYLPPRQSESASSKKRVLLWQLSRKPRVWLCQSVSWCLMFPLHYYMSDNIPVTIVYAFVCTYICLHILYHTNDLVRILLLLYRYKYIYIHIHMERDIHTHSFQFPGCLAPNIQTCHTFHRPSPTTAAAPSPNTTLNGLRWIRWSPTGPTWYCNNSRYNMTGGTTFKENTYIYIYVCVCPYVITCKMTVSMTGTFSIRTLWLGRCTEYIHLNKRTRDNLWYLWTWALLGKTAMY
jgi:hypothetical protein